MCYIAVISFISVAVCALDKSRAKRGGRRISEKTLFTLSALGGAAAMYITMLRIRHKTKHMRFMIGLPLIFMLQLAVAAIMVDKLLLR